MLNENEILEFLERNKDYKILLNYCEDNNTIDCIFAFDFNTKNSIKPKTNHTDYYFIELNGEYLFYYEFEKILLIDKKLEKYCLNVLQIPVGLHYLANENYKIQEIWNILNE